VAAFPVLLAVLHVIERAAHLGQARNSETSTIHIVGTGEIFAPDVLQFNCGE
jgi:hypothetical protein